MGTKFYTDTLFASEKSMMGFTCAQLFTDGRGYNKFYPMKKKSDAGHSLWSFFSEVGIPQTLVTDGAKEETQGKFKQVVDDSLVQLRRTEPMSPWQNRAESEIGRTKKLITRHTRRKSSPRRCWCWCGKWVSAITCLTAGDMPSLIVRTPAERIKGNTPDISEYAQFDWYEPVWYWDTQESMLKDKQKLGRFIGVADDVGQAMTN